MNVPTSERVGLYLSIVEPNDWSLSHCAETLGLSESTLCRQLRREGTRFKVLMDEVRTHRAIEFLREGHKTWVAAELVGMADSYCLARLFKRRGLCVTDFRRAA